MNVQSLIGRKIDQTQGFLEDGTRVPLSIISVEANVVSQIKTQEHEGYNSVQLGFAEMKKPNKPMLGHIKKAGLESKSPRFFREIRVDDVPDLTLGSAISVSEVFEPGDIVDVTGTSKGKGYAGVVKRHGFHGGPKTHGQSDRHRAPGASGTGTTPGHVYKGKRMSGRMGNEQVTIKNLEILEVKEDMLLVRGLIPGVKGAIVTVKKVGKTKKFTPLWSEKKTEDVIVEAAEPKEDQKIEEKVEVQAEENSVEASEGEKKAAAVNSGEPNPPSHEASEGKEEVNENAS